MTSTKSFGDIEGVTYFPGNEKSNKPVCIMGSIHGNERIGAAVLERLKNELSSLEIEPKSDIYLVIGNPEAYRRNVRFVDTDMNRLFSVDRDIHQPGNNIEEKRAREIAPVLTESYYLLDLHSTIKPSVPFVYCEPDSDHLELANLMGVKYIVSTIANFRPADLITSADNFVDRNGGFGITFESGWHQDPLAIDSVLFLAKLFLQKTGACDFGLCEPKKLLESKKLIIYNHVVPDSSSFTFAVDFDNFSMISKGDIIGNDGGIEVRAERDSFVIFPKKYIQNGKVACYLAHVS
ncbi:MAG: succinylglutamate desuccinylase/aspartoacylase family protein [Patescibacteria group bacterium]